MQTAQIIQHRRKPILYHEGTNPLGGEPFQDGWVQPFSGRAERRLKKAGFKVGSLADAYHYPHAEYAKPRDCQRDMLRFHLKFRRALNLSEMRTGKSAPTVWGIDLKMKHYGLDRTLIIAPPTVITDTWEPEIFNTLPHLNVYYAIDSTKKCNEALASGKYSIVVLNPRKVDLCLDAIQAWNPQYIVTDEFTEFKSHETSQYAAYEQLFINEYNWREALFMSGTPCPQRPTDVWSIIRFVNPRTPVKFSTFERQVIVKNGGAYNPHKWEKTDDAIEIVASFLTPSIRYRTEDVNDMPKHEHVSFKTEMGKAQARMYKQMKNHFITDDDGQVATAANAAVRMFKLLQIANGTVYGEPDEPPMICGAPPKLAEMLRLIEQTPKKTVIMVGWKAQQSMIKEFLEKKGYKADIINGSIKGRKRQAAINNFQKGDTDVLICHPKTTKHGTKLDAASLLIWFGATVSSEYFLQASARIRGVGTGATVVAELRCTPLERERFEMLRTMQWTQEQIVDVYRRAA